MKKIYILAIALGAFTFSANAQFTDDIESYGLGPVHEGPWTSWSGAPGPEDGIVTDDEANSGSQSIVIQTGPQDCVLDFVDAAPSGSGVWTAAWMMYVPSGKSAYFNLQGNTIPNANANLQFISGNILFNGLNATPGAGTDDNGNGPTAFTFPHDFWFPVIVEVDTTGETYSLDINGTQYPTVPYNAAGDYFGGVDFFASDAVNLYYVDDVQFVEGALGVNDFSADVFSVYPNPVKNVLNISSKAAVDSITVYDILGKVVLTASPDMVSPSIDMSGLSSGAYLVNVKIGNASKTVKVIK